MKTIMSRRCALAFALALGASLTVTALAAEPAPKKDALTIEQTLSVAAGLQQMQKYETTDKDGKPATGYYDFGANLRILMARNIELGRTAQASFERALNDLKMKFSEGSGTVPEEKRGLFTFEASKLSNSPSYVEFYHIKLQDLCLEAKPPECKIANPIPAPILSLIIPILDLDEPKR